MGKKDLKRSLKPMLTLVKRASGKKQPHLGEAIVTGLVGGLVGTIVMTEFQNAWSKAQQARKDGNSQQQQSSEEKEDATMKTAGKIASIFGQELSHEQKKKLGPVVHYSFGTIQGGVYAAGLELTRMRGGVVPALAFGGGLFLLADEVAVPKLGLSGSAAEAPLSSHIYALVSHLVYSMSTEVVRRGVRSLAA